MYAEIDDIKEHLTEKVLSQLSNDHDPTIVNQEVVQTYITDATEVINSYLRGRYSLPLTNTHSVLKNICTQLVQYELYKRRGKLPETIKDTYKEAIENLVKIQKGIITLDEGDDKSRPGFYLVSSRKELITRKHIDNY